MLICTVAFAVVLLAVVSFIPLSGRGRSREPANVATCPSNMRQIGIALALYANENRGAYPPDLATLLATQDIMPYAFVCPSESSTAATRPWSDDAAARSAGMLDYVYIGEGLTNATTAEVPVLFERSSAHHGGGNILFGDGHVDHLSTAQFMKLVASIKDPAKLDAAERGLVTRP